MNVMQRFLISVSEDPVKYAMRVLVCLALALFLALFLALVVRNAISAGEEIVLANFACKDGICMTTEEDVDRLEAAIKALAEKIRACGKVSI